MKYKQLLLIALVAHGFLPFLYSQSPTESTISEVQVYTGSARVTRQTDVDLLSGENVLSFSGLPSSLDVNQIQVGFKEGVPIRFDNLKFQRIKDREDTDIEESLKDSIEELQGRIQILNAQKGDQSSRVKFANSLSTSFTEGFGLISPQLYLSLVFFLPEFAPQIKLFFTLTTKLRQKKGKVKIKRGGN